MTGSLHDPTSGDAEIIPIGSTGRPGRGSGRSRPSASSRSLAPAKSSPSATTPPKARKAGATSTTTPAKSVAAPAKKRPTKRATGAAASPAVSPSKPVREAAQAPAAPTSRPEQHEAVASPRRSPTSTAARVDQAAGGIPAGEIAAAIALAAREVFGEAWERRLAGMLSLIRRRLSGDYEVDEFGFDAEITEKFFMTATRPIAEKWFRVEVRGIENIPAEGGALVVSNHSGTLPIDGLVTTLVIHDHAGRFLRPLGADLVFKLPIVSSLARQGGATLACHDDAERMLTNGELVGVWPEGFKGIGKPFSERYKLQRFGRGGFVSAALRTGVPIIPLSVVGAEEIYPLVGNIPSLARLLGLPYIPITPFFPLLGPLGLLPLPSKWILEFGEPIRTDEYSPDEAEDPMLVFNVTDQVRETIQQSLYRLLLQRESVFR